MGREIIAEVTVLNWDEYNPRKDVTKSSWFRMEHDFLERADVFGFTHSELVTWWYILSICSKQSTGHIALNYVRALRLLRLRSSTVTSALTKLAENNMIRFEIRNVKGTAKCSTNERTNERNETEERKEKNSPADSVERPPNEVPAEILDANAKLLERRQRESINNLLDGKFGKLAEGGSC